MQWLRFWVMELAGVVAAGAQTAGADLNDLGNRAADLGNFAAAEPYYRKAVEQFRALGPDYEAHLAASLVNLGATLCGQGNRAEGAKLFEEALVLHRRTLGPDHLRTLVNVNRMAVNYLAMGDGDRAEGLFAAALPVERRLYPEDQQLAQSLAGLAAIRLGKGQTTQALAMAEEALEIARKTAGDSSLEAAQMYANVAEVHRHSGRTDRALPLYRKARFLYEKALGPQDARVASLLSQEGLILLGEGKLTLAEQSLGRAVELMRERCPLCIPEMAAVENNLGLLRLKQKRYRDADRLLTDVLSLQERFAVKPIRQMADTLHNLSVVREKQRLHADAILLQNRAAMLLGYR